MSELTYPALSKSTIVRLKVIRAACRSLNAVAPAAAAPLAARLFRTPHRPKRPAREQRWSEPAHRVQLASRFGALPGWSWGSGPGTVLLVHGWSGRGLQLGAFAAPLAERGLRVVAYDAPAHGEAAGRLSSLPELAAVAADVAGELQPLTAVVAHSLGGVASLWAAARGELQARRFVTLGAPSDFTAITDRFAALTGFSPAVIEHMRQRFEHELSFSWQELTPVQLCGGLEPPLLVVHDRDDREIPWEEGRSLAEAAPDPRFVVTTGLGHRRLLLDADVVAAVTDFVSQDLAEACEPAVVPIKHIATPAPAMA